MLRPPSGCSSPFVRQISVTEGRIVVEPLGLFLPMSVLHEFKPKKPLRYDLENLNRYARKPVVLADQITLRDM
jgi:hypothetical protein